MTRGELSQRKHFYFELGMESGWIKLHRKLLDNPIMRHPVALQVFIWCALRAQREPYRHATRWGATTLERGEVMVARRGLSDALGCSERNIRTAIRLLSEEKIISIKTTNTHTIIKLEKYDFFQADERKATSTRPALDQHSTQEQEVREGKKEKKDLKPAASPPALGFDPIAIAIEAIQSAGGVVLNRDAKTIAILRANAKKLGEQKFRDAVSYYAKEDFYRRNGLTLKGLLDALDKCANAAQASKPIPKYVANLEDVF